VGLLTGLLIDWLWCFKGLSENPFELILLSCKVEPEDLKPFEELEELKLEENKRLNSLKVTLASLSISRRLNVERTSSSVTSIPLRKKNLRIL
jgi:hypothetical protein